MSLSGDFNDPLKEVIRNIVWCSGEPFTVSAEVVELLFAHLRCCCTRVVNCLPNSQPTLADLLTAVRHDTLKLVRIFEYFRVLNGSQDLPCTEEDVVEDEYALVTYVDDTKTDLSRISALCTQLDIPSPDAVVSTTSKLRTNFIKGRRLRLTRIDRKFIDLSNKDYITFTKIRQSATLLIFTRYPQILSFWRWIFLQSKYATELTLNDDANASLRPEVRECIRVLAHILTGDILDVVDLSLFHRRKLGINLQAPITPVEVKQSLRLISKLFAFTDS